MSSFSLRAPAPDAACVGPVLVEVPHAGLSVPDPVAAQIRAPIDARMRDSDVWVDRLYAGAPARGAHLLVAHASRYVVDLNRAADDIDPTVVVGAYGRRAGRGVIWRAATDGNAVLRRKLTRVEVQERLDRFYHPYHAAIVDTLAAMRSKWGFAILLAAHSMPAMGRNVRGGPLVRRADVVPGTLGRTSAAAPVIDTIDAVFRRAGLSVAHDDPYRGGFSTQHYGRPAEGIHAVQVELSRGLYVDEMTSRPTHRFDELVGSLDELVGELVALRL